MSATLALTRLAIWDDGPVEEDDAGSSGDIVDLQYDQELSDVVAKSCVCVSLLADDCTAATPRIAGTVRERRQWETLEGRQLNAYLQSVRRYLPSCFLSFCVVGKSSGASGESSGSP